MWISRSFFSFLMRNVILNKNLPNKQMFTKYSYFSFEPCTYIPADASYFPTLYYRIWCISKWNNRNIHLLFMWLVLIGSTLLTMWSFELKECGRNFFLWHTVVDVQDFSHGVLLWAQEAENVYIREMVLEFLFGSCVRKVISISMEWPTDATVCSEFISLQVHSTCFGRYTRPSSGVQV